MEGNLLYKKRSMASKMGKGGIGEGGTSPKKSWTDKKLRSPRGLARGGYGEGATSPKPSKKWPGEKSGKREKETTLEGVN